MERTHTITPDTILARNDRKFITSAIGDEIVMMSMESGNYIGLNNMGSVIWQQLEKPCTVKELVAYLTDSYDISGEECEKKTMKYLDDMLQQEMLIIN